MELGVSRRTAQYAFQDTLNLNPIAYLRAVRLNHVRRELRLGDSVTTAATKWGFWHLSSFAQDYRAMFGELPSATAKRAPGALAPVVHAVIVRRPVVRTGHRPATSLVLLFLLRLHLPLLDELPHIAHRHAAGVLRIDLVEVLRHEAETTALRLRLRHAAPLPSTVLAPSRASTRCCACCCSVAPVDGNTGAAFVAGKNGPSTPRPPCGSFTGATACGGNA